MLFHVLIVSVLLFLQGALTAPLPAPVQKRDYQDNVVIVTVRAAKCPGPSEPTTTSTIIQYVSETVDVTPDYYKTSSTPVVSPYSSSSSSTTTPYPTITTSAYATVAPAAAAPVEATTSSTTEAATPAAVLADAPVEATTSSTAEATTPAAVLAAAPVEVTTSSVAEVTTPAAPVETTTSPTTEAATAAVAPIDAARVVSETPVAVAPAASSSASGSFSGQATYYDVGMGACGITNSNSELVAAINKDQYGVQANPNTAPVCGQCILIQGPNNSSVKVRVVDRCPACSFGDLDLSPTAFGALSPLGAGRISISWSFVSC
ncbi:hypothetical protein BB560_002034 [Smittium megazygosporum]|uniref:RlpA-like protein double-psi beta-barrel domain-containing protein n=1 Tax=Smittium megazygosporum TaxID=133381 RepID=A0A2T9ZFV3_9FUNG|nr:hypothetical protein BB560_002034 [Smittium megazygosporum]